MQARGHLIADAAFPSPAVIQSCENHDIKYTFSFSAKLYPELASVGKTNLLEHETRVFESETRGQTVCFFSDKKVVKVITNNFSTSKTGFAEPKEREKPLFSLATTKHFLHMSDYEWEQICVPLLREKGITKKSKEDALMELTGWILSANPPVNVMLESAIDPASMELQYKGKRYEKPDLLAKKVVELQKIATELNMNIAMSGKTKATLADRIYKRTHPEQYKKEGFIQSLVDNFLKDKIKGKPQPLHYYSSKFNLVDRMDHWFYQDLYDHSRKDFDWESYLMWCLVDIGTFDAWGIYCDLYNIPLEKDHGMREFVRLLSDELLLKYSKNLKKKPTSQKRKKEEEEDEVEDEYEVEKLLQSKTIKGKVYYLVKWKGYSSKDATWEHEMDLHCPKLLREFYVEKKKRQRNE